MTGKETNMFCNGGVGVDDSIMKGQVGGRQFNSIPSKREKGLSGVLVWRSELVKHHSANWREEENYCYIVCKAVLPAHIALAFAALLRYACFPVSR